jgi:hypothetical protein
VDAGLLLLPRPMCCTTTEKVCSMAQFFVAVAGDGGALQWVCLGPTRPAAPTNGTVRAAGDTNCPYKWVDL